VGDVNEDGILDLVNGRPGGFGLFLGNGDGSVHNTLTISPGTSGMNPLLGDYNGDGHLDVVTHEYNLGLLNLYSGNGDGTFRGVQTLALAGTGGHFVFIGGPADLNDDGRDDIVATDFYSGLTAVVGGTSNGQLSLLQSFSVGNGGWGTFGDFNGDGVEDLIKGNDATAPTYFAAGNVDSSRYAVRMRLLDFTSISSVREEIAYLDSIATRVSKERGAIGAVMSRLDVASRALGSRNEGAIAARSRIIDADVASEAADLSRSQIVQQAAAAVLAQANQQPSLALQLLRTS
jgi:flagellin-like hook-associated protein FlgL